MNSYQNAIQPGISRPALNEGQSSLSATAEGKDPGITLETVLPEPFAKAVMEATVRVGWHGTPFGSVFLAITARGISRIDFTSRDHPDLPLDRLRLAWPLAEFVHDQKGTLDAAAAICQPPHSTNPLRLYVPATRFQSAVWQALLQIPSGTVVSYSQLASVVGRPRASRAVGNAVGANPVACLIPCHRVIQQNGALGSYRWGSDRKQRILSWESRQCQSRAGG